MRQAITFMLIGFSMMMICGVCCSAAQRCAEPANRNTPSCAILHDIVDCTTDNAKALIGEFGGLVRDEISSHTGSDGVIQWGELEDEFKDAGIADGMCVLADVAKELLTRSTSSATPDHKHPRADSVSQGFDVLRSHLAPGVKFKTPHGEI